MRIVSVRETAWINAKPARVWSQLTDIENWPDWCQGISKSELRQRRGQVRLDLTRSELTRRDSTRLELNPGARWELFWDLRPPAPLQGGVISLMRDPEEVRIRKVGHLLNFRREKWSALKQETPKGDRDRLEDYYQLAWTAGWGPFRSDACISLGTDGSGTWVEFLVSWQGWGAWLTGLGQGKRHMVCGQCQRLLLADLQITMERIGTYG